MENLGVTEILVAPATINKPAKKVEAVDDVTFTDIRFMYEGQGHEPAPAVPFPPMFCLHNVKSAALSVGTVVVTYHTTSA